LSKSEAINPIKIELGVEASELLRKENKEGKGDLEGKVYAPHLGLLIDLPPFLNLAFAFSRTPCQ